MRRQRWSDGLCRSLELGHRHSLLDRDFTPPLPDVLDLLERRGGQVALAAVRTADEGHALDEELRTAGPSSSSPQRAANGLRDVQRPEEPRRIEVVFAGLVDDPYQGMLFCVAIRQRSIELSNLQRCGVPGIPHTDHEAGSPTIFRRHALLR